MLGNKIIVVMPAYNADKTLLRTYDELPHEYIDDIVLVDDASNDNTVQTALSLGITTIVHGNNKGYGANQKTCYETALNLSADVIIMLHPDYQYSPRLVTAMASMVISGHYDIVLGSRILGGGALTGGMPIYKYISNRLLTAFQNIMTGAKLSEYHTGFRAYRSSLLKTIPLKNNSDSFVFDNEILIQSIYFKYNIGEISCPTNYFNDASSISFINSIKYGFGVLITTIKYMLQKYNIYKFNIFERQ
ncbi:MAG: glycosyltransferase family 2 protein [Desulfuromonadaceae bacterium]|nr:glycosyltransferase family 2 protein [Desulfuromonadaceae bacterium]